MYSGYGSFGGVEIFNHARMMSYMTGNLELGVPALRAPNTSVNPNCFCPTAQPLYCDQGAGENGEYLGVALDPAPWYDPDEPGSTEFAGFFVEEITGFDSTVAREVADGAIFGSSLGPLRLKGRCMTVTGWLRSKTCCGSEYALRWLQEALMGDGSCENCATSDLYMLKCCPPENDTCYLNLLDDHALRPVAINVTVTDLGGGLYTLVTDDSSQTNIISSVLSSANNEDGFAPLAHISGNAWRLSLTPDVGSSATDTIYMPDHVVTSYLGTPSGSGASVTWEIDTSILSDCEDEQALVAPLIEALDGLVSTYGSGNPAVLYPVGMGRTYMPTPGINPVDYIRLLHRTGLTDGVKVLERHGTCCSTCGCTNLKVQFTICSELPYIFSDLTWCAQDALFSSQEYCLNLKKLCGQCGNPSPGMRSYERLVPRPECGISIRHDGTWCADGWDPAVDGCPPNDCKIVVREAVEWTATDGTTGDGCTPGTSTTADSCLVRIFEDGSWSPVGWSIADGFPPPYCTLSVENGGKCNDGDPAPDPPEEPCLIRVIYDECNGEQRWEAIRWSTNPFPNPGCACVEIAETCTISCGPADGCASPTECPIDIHCNGTWSPIGWTLDPTAPFPDPNCTYFFPGQDESPVIDVVQIPADVFVPDCGPLPIAPPAPFLITTNCYCEPWVTKRQCCSFTNPGDWNDATTYIEIYTGSQEMRRLKIEAFQNPFGEAVPCPCDPNDPFWECRDACASVVVPQLPASSTLIIDSRLKTAQLILPGGTTVSAMRYIFSADGAPFNWFDIAQCSTFCVVASVDTQFVADDARLSIGMATRYLTSGW